MRKPTKEQFKEWLETARPTVMRMYSITDFYKFLGGKKVRLKTINISQYTKPFRKWIFDVWTPFFNEFVRPNKEEFNINSFMLGSNGQVMQLTTKKAV